MLSWDPGLIVLGARDDNRTICTVNARRGGLDGLGALEGFCACAVFAWALLRREEGFQPGAVDEVAGAAEEGAKEQIEEDTTLLSVSAETANGSE